jgi:hypothetical protein
MDQLTAPAWQTAYANRYSKEVERHYCARLVRLLECHDLGPIVVTGGNDPVDLIIAGIPVELKVSRAYPDPQSGIKTRYQALLRDPKNHHYLNGDVLIFLTVDPADRLHPFVIPRCVLGNRRKITITSHPETYTGQWTPYLRAYEYLTPDYSVDKRELS